MDSVPARENLRTFQLYPHKYGAPPAAGLAAVARRQRPHAAVPHAVSHAVRPTLRSHAAVPRGASPTRCVPRGGSTRRSHIAALHAPGTGPVARSIMQAASPPSASPHRIQSGPSHSLLQLCPMPYARICPAPYALCQYALSALCLHACGAAPPGRQGSDVMRSDKIRSHTLYLITVGQRPR